MKAQLVLVGLLAVLLSVGLVWWLARSGRFSPGDNENPEERVEQQQQFEQDFSIRFRDRYRSLSGPARIVVLCLILTVSVVGYFVWSAMQAGRPASSLLSPQVMMGIVGLTGVVAGIKYEQWVQRRLGELHVIYERLGESPETKTVKFFRDAVYKDDGRAVVPELVDNRLFGIFFRSRLIGESRELRSSPKPNGDTVTHKVPDHGAETDDGDFIVRTWMDSEDSGEHVTSSPSASSDYLYSSPNSLSDEDAVAIRQQNQRMRIRLREIKSTNAELYEKVSRMRSQIENEEYKSREDFKQDLTAITEQLAPLLQSASNSIESESGSDDGSRSVLDQLDDDE